jgi:hypothetical protein
MNVASGGLGRPSISDLAAKLRALIENVAQGEERCPKTGILWDRLYARSTHDEWRSLNAPFGWDAV